MSQQINFLITYLFIFCILFLSCNEKYYLSRFKSFNYKLITTSAENKLREQRERWAIIHLSARKLNDCHQCHEDSFCCDSWCLITLYCIIQLNSFYSLLCVAFHVKGIVNLIFNNAAQELVIIFAAVDYLNFRMSTWFQHYQFGSFQNQFQTLEPKEKTQFLQSIFLLHFSPLTLFRNFTFIVTSSVLSLLLTLH